MYERLKKLCEEQNIKITTLCLMVTNSGSNLSTWKKGYMRSDYLLKCAEILDCSVDYLLGRSTRDTFLNEEEKEVLEAYRNHPEMHEAVNKLLGVETTNNIADFSAPKTDTIVEKAAFGGGTQKEKISKEEAKKRENALEKITKKFPSVDD